MMTGTPLVIWHRPEFQGREAELIHPSAIAALAGVTRAAVTNWSNRHADFPAVVAVQGAERYAPRLYVRAEIEAWLPSRARKGRERCEILAEKAYRATRRIRQEEQNIEALTVKLNEANQRLASAREELETLKVQIENLEE
ncbi:hypothetical protein ABT391_34985 [Streptomyces jumonjinensis]|uniref:hypothetical protein n=1 Tax=Streptomyces jumonjinensis TaxID=1945 RepID=UPI00332C2D8E